MRLSLALAAVLSLHLPHAALAAVPDSFETVLQGLRASVLQTRRDQKQVRALADASEIQRASSDSRSLDNAADRLRWNVSDIRRRASTQGRRPGPGRPGPGRPGPGQPNRDPFFESDLRRVVWDLRDFRMRMGSLSRDVERLDRGAAPDPASVGPAQTLTDEASRLRSSVGWLTSEARWARMDLSSAGYTFEAMDVERETQDAERASYDIERDARSLLQRVRQP